MYPSQKLLPISALQHLLFCRRQCALIHIERLWVENSYTAEGRNMHSKVHSGKYESRKTKKTATSLKLVSYKYGLLGESDVVEFKSDGTVYVVEYKRGKPKNSPVDKVQLCAQVLCLEEMLNIQINESFLFYGKIKHREKVYIDDSLKDATINLIKDLHDFIEIKVTPKPEYNKKCRPCSFFDICLPKIFSKNKDVQKYIEKMIIQDLGDDKL